MRALARLVISAVAIFAISTLHIVPGFHVRGFAAAAVAAVLLAVVNVLIRPIVLLFTLPINIVTLGLFTLVINGLMLGLVSALVAGFSVAGLGSAILGALAVSIVTWILNKVFDVGKEND